MEAMEATEAMEAMKGPFVDQIPGSVYLKTGGELCFFGSTGSSPRTFELLECDRVVVIGEHKGLWRA